MPTLKATSDDGRDINVHISPFLSWVLGLASIAIVAGVGLMLDLNVRVSVIEKSRFTAADAQSLEHRLESQFVPRDEIAVMLVDIRDRLRRIEANLDGGD